VDGIERLSIEIDELLAGLVCDFDTLFGSSDRSTSWRSA
jgi:hypothetical protein